MRVLITNVYSFRNKGDAAIVLALLQEVKRVFKNSETYIQTADIENDKEVYGVPVSPTLLWLMLSAHRKKKVILQVLLLVSYLIFTMLYIFLFKVQRYRSKFYQPRGLKNFFEDIEKADLIIACGGGYLRTESSSAKNSVLLLVTCLNFLSAHYLNRPVYLYSQSVGPVYGNLQKNILRFALNRVNIIEPREDISINYLNTLNLKSTIIQTADPVFSLNIENKFTSLNVKDSVMNVGFTVRKWFSNQAQYDQYVRSFAVLIDNVSKDKKAHFYYIPQVIASNFGDDDRKVAEDVLKLVENKKAVTLISHDMHPLEIAGFCSKLDYFVGTRMHSNIYAIINLVPALAIEYEPKTRGIMRSLGLENYTINIADATGEVLLQKFNKLCSEREIYINILKENIRKVKFESSSAIEHIYADYKK